MSKRGVWQGKRSWYLIMIVRGPHTTARRYLSGQNVLAQLSVRSLPNQNLDDALRCAEVMGQHGIPMPRKHVYFLLQGFGTQQDLGCCRRLQSLVGHSGGESVAILNDHLIRQFASCGSLMESNEAFSKVPKPSRFTWSAILGAHVLSGTHETVLHLFERMVMSGVKSDKHVYLAGLKACIGSLDVNQGRCIHNEIMKHGLQLDEFVGSTLIDMYSKCGSLDEARKVFDTLQKDNVVLWNAMISGYVKCGNMDEACNLFNILPNRDLVSWTTMVVGYIQNNEPFSAFECFEKMQNAGMKSDRVTFSSALKACGSIGAIDQGRLIHKQIVACRIHSDAIIGSALVDMYAKCGSLNEACSVFEKVLDKDCIIWSSMIASYAQCGNFELAIQCFKNMCREGVKPNDVTFTTILSACGQAGLVDEGRNYFLSMREHHNIIPDARHYHCMVDLLGRAGHLNEAENFLQMIEPDIIAWTSLLAACRIYGNVELGRQCFDQVTQLDPQCGGGHVLMAGIYSDAGMSKDAANIEDLRHHAGAWKKPAKAWIEVNNKVHEFVVGDRSHPQSGEIYATLRKLKSHMKEVGYAPRISSVVQEISDEEKEDALCGHCEKLAIVFGLISTSPGTTIRVSKNLRVCTDCHNAGKAISQIEHREIIIRDAYRIHRFQNGVCSCGDYF